MLRLAVCGLALMGVLAALGRRATPAHADGGAPVVAYVLGAGNGACDLAVIEIAARKVVALVSFDRAPAAIALRGDSQVLYVAVPDDNRVVVLDATTLRVQSTLPTGRGPDALAVDTAVTGNLFVANGGSGTVTVLDVGTARVLATNGVGAHPAGIAVAGPTSGIREARDAEVYVANSGANSVTVLSAVRRQVLATIPVPGGPSAIVVPATGGVAYVGTRAGTVVALDLAAHAVLGPLLVLRGGAMGQMDYDAITGQIYIPDAAGGAVAVLRPVPAPTAATAPTLPAEPALTYPIVGGPNAVAIPSDGAYGFVTEGQRGRVVMVDVDARETLAAMVVGGAPRAVVAGPYLPLIGAGAGGGGGPSVLIGILVAGFVALLAWIVLGVLWWRGVIGGRRRHSV